MKEDFDVVVIGGGVGGLAAALSLQMSGKKVLLVERQNQLGGSAAMYRRGRFEFGQFLDAVHGVNSGDSHEWLRKALSENERVKVEFAPLTQLFRLFAKSKRGKRYDVKLPVGEASFVKAMESAVPGCGKSMRDFFNLAKQCASGLDECRRMMRASPLRGETLAPGKDAFANCADFVSVAEYPFNKVLHNIGLSRDAIDILDSFSVFFGSDCDDAGFAYIASNIYKAVERGPLFCRPDMLFCGMEEAFRRHGGQVWFGAKATRICTDGQTGRISGTEVAGHYVGTRAVVADLDPATVYGTLLDKAAAVPPRERKRPTASKPGLRFFTACVGLDRDAKSLGIEDSVYVLLKALESPEVRAASEHLECRQCMVTVPDVIAGYSEKGTCTLNFRIWYSVDVWSGLSAPDYAKAKEDLLNQAIAVFRSETGIKIDDCIEEAETSTPRTVAGRAGITGGIAGYRITGLDSVPARCFSVRSDQPFVGLKLCSGFSGMGPGLGAAIDNGYDAAQMILSEVDL